MNEQPTPLDEFIAMLRNSAETGLWFEIPGDEAAQLLNYIEMLLEEQLK